MGSVSVKLHCLPSESLGLGARWLDSGLARGLSILLRGRTVRRHQEPWAQTDDSSP